MYYHEISLIGKRPQNEDKIDVILNINQETNYYKNLNFYAVYDGHGGPHISSYLKDKLSNYFVNNLVEYVPSKNKTYNDYIIKIYNHIQSKLIGCQLQSKTSGSTALVIIHYTKNSNHYLKIINLGDCRAVICNNSNIAIPLSKDHKPSSYDETIRINNSNGIITQDYGDDSRINGLSVSRSFGDLDAPLVIHIPDIYDYDITREKFLILACDGVWDVLSNQDAVDFVLFQLDTVKINCNLKTRTNKNIAYLLGEHAINKGSQDNISVLIIFL
jgi:serine/threonine protein phosphatase PrpC